MQTLCVIAVILWAGRRQAHPNGGSESSATQHNYFPLQQNQLPALPKSSHKTAEGVENTHTHAGDRAASAESHLCRRKSWKISEHHYSCLHHSSTW